MRKFGFLLWLPFLLLAVAASAQTCSDPAQRAVVVGDFDSGTRLTATLVNKVSAQRAWYDNLGFVPDSKVIARIDNDLVCHGQIVIPRGSTLVGSIVGRNSRGSSHPQSSMKIAFYKLHLRGKRTLPIDGVIGAVAAPSAAPLDVTSIGVSGLSGLELDTNEAAITSLVQKDVSLPAGTQLVVLAQPPPALVLMRMLGFLCTDATSSGLAMYLILDLKKGIQNADARIGESVAASTVGERCLENTVIPAKSRMIGHITEVKIAMNPGEESRLGIVFDKVLLPGHHELRIRGELIGWQVATLDYQQPNCQAGVSADFSDSGNPAGTETCSAGGFHLDYRDPGPGVTLDHNGSLISSNTGRIDLHAGDRLGVKITALK